MSKKPKEKNIQKSIYFEPEVLARLERDMKLSTRKLSQEVNHDIKRLFALRDKSDDEAIKLADSGNQHQNEPR